MINPNKTKPSGSGKQQRVNQKIRTKKFNIIQHLKYYKAYITKHLKNYNNQWDK